MNLTQDTMISQTRNRQNKSYSATRQGWGNLCGKTGKELQLFLY